METPHVNSDSSASRRENPAHVTALIKPHNQIGCGAHRKNTRTPAALTGCISKVSAITPKKHAYFDALKDYAHRYAEAQAYLVDTEWQITHDYSFIDSSPVELDHGLLDDNGEPMQLAQISDDDIDNCGYLGWLRH